MLGEKEKEEEAGIEENAKPCNYRMKLVYIYSFSRSSKREIYFTHIHRVTLTLSCITVKEHIIYLYIYSKCSTSQRYPYNKIRMYNCKIFLYQSSIFSARARARTTLIVFSSFIHTCPRIPVRQARTRTRAHLCRPCTLRDPLYSYFPLSLLFSSPSSSYTIAFTESRARGVKRKNRQTGV